MINIWRSCLDSAKNTIFGCLGLGNTGAPTNPPQEKRKDVNDNATRNEPQKLSPEKPTGTNEVEPSIADREITEPLVNDESSVNVPNSSSSTDELEPSIADREFTVPLVNEESPVIVPNSSTPAALSEPGIPDLHPPTNDTDLSPDMTVDRDPLTEFDATTNQIVQEGEVLHPLPVTDEPGSVMKSDPDPIVDATKEKLVFDANKDNSTIQQLCAPAAAVEEGEDPVATAEAASGALDIKDPGLQIIPKEEDSAGPVMPSVDSGPGGQVN